MNHNKGDIIMQDILFFSVVLKERLWGGNKLASRYGKKSDKLIGEAWILSGHSEGESVVKNGSFKGRTLNDLYLNEKQLFGASNYEKFPLLIKILDAQKMLSVQVHPNDEYAMKHHHDYGKNECWYILSAKKGANIIYGQKVRSKTDFKDAIDNQKWDEVLNYVPVKKDDFYNVPVGTIHAIGGGIEILEIQQSSDVTYRLYDFDRVDQNGKKRELHIKESLDVIDFDVKRPLIELKKYGDVERLVENKYFTVDKVIPKSEVYVKNGTDLYTILYARKRDVTIVLNGKKYQIKKNKVALLSKDVNEFTILPEGELFIVKERALSLNLMYDM